VENVFEHFTPTLPEAYRDTPIVLLANIAPDLQHHVLDQVRIPRFVIADTMDLWINIARQRLVELLARVHLLILNDGEARQLTGETSLIKAARKLRDMGPQYVAVKKGEHGCLLFGGDGQFFSCPAYPLEDIHDPTGAGDTFAGGLASTPRERWRGRNFPHSACGCPRKCSGELQCRSVQSRKTKTVTSTQIAERYEMFRRLSQFDAGKAPFSQPARFACQELGLASGFREMETARCSMKVLITGGAGFIGSHLAEYLRARRGANPPITSRSQSANTDRRGIDVVQASILIRLRCAERCQGGSFFILPRW
jgi:hypothetical protein